MHSDVCTRPTCIVMCAHDLHTCMYSDVYSVHVLVYIQHSKGTFIALWQLVHVAVGHSVP